MTAPVGDDPTWLDDLERARAAATEGPWHVAPSGGIDAGDYDTVIGRGDVDCMSHCYGGTSTIEGDNLAADLRAAVAAVNAVPTVIAELRKRDAAREELLELAREVAAASRAWRAVDPDRTAQLQNIAKRIELPLTAALTPESVPT